MLIHPFGLFIPPDQRNAGRRVIRHHQQSNRGDLHQSPDLIEGGGLHLDQVGAECSDLLQMRVLHDDGIGAKDAGLSDGNPLTFRQLQHLPDKIGVRIDLFKGDIIPQALLQIGVGQRPRNRIAGCTDFPNLKFRFEGPHRPDEDQLLKVQLAADEQIIQHVAASGRRLNPCDFQPVLFHQKACAIAPRPQLCDLEAGILQDFVRAVGRGNHQRVVHRFLFQAKIDIGQIVDMKAMHIFQNFLHSICHLKTLLLQKLYPFTTGSL